MPWATFVLLIASTYVALKLLTLTKKRERLKFLGLTIAAGIFWLMQLSHFVDLLIEGNGFSPVANFLMEWGHITCLAFILSSLAVFIRESKPVFAQFPLLYTGLPLLIVLSYLLVKDTYALKTWLISIYQGGAILVALLMYFVYTYRKNEYGIILSGVVIFLFSYMLFWYVPGMQQSYGWIWKLLVAIGMVTVVLGYEHTETYPLTQTQNVQ